MEDYKMDIEDFEDVQRLRMVYKKDHLSEWDRQDIRWHANRYKFEIEFPDGRVVQRWISGAWLRHAIERVEAHPRSAGATTITLIRSSEWYTDNFLKDCALTEDEIWAGCGDYEDLDRRDVPKDPADRIPKGFCPYCGFRPGDRSSKADETGWCPWPCDCCGRTFYEDSDEYDPMVKLDDGRTFQVHYD